MSTKFQVFEGIEYEDNSVGFRTQGHYSPSQDLEAVIANLFNATRQDCSILTVVEFGMFRHMPGVVLVLKQRLNRQPNEPYKIWLIKRFDA